MFRKILIPATIFVAIFAIFACSEKEEILSPENSGEMNNLEEIDFDYKGYEMTLEEFIKSVTTEEEKSFFENSEIVDNSLIATDIINSQTQIVAMDRPIIRFRWGNGCRRPIGICLIIPIGNAEANAKAIISEGKYVIIPETDDNGITSDGFLPVYKDIYVDKETTIEAGIYKVNYDDEQGKYTYVALNIK